MKIEGLIGRTLRARPSGVSAPMALAVRAGFVRPSAGGWILLPLGVRVVDRMAGEILAGLDAQPLSLPSGGQADAARHLTGLFQAETQSYRQLPLRIATSLSACEASPGRLAPVTGVPLLAIAAACTVEASLRDFMERAAANLGALGGSAGLNVRQAHGVGEERSLVSIGANRANVVLGCAACGTLYLHAAAPFARVPLSQASAPLERVHTPGASTIQSLAEMLGIGREQTLKALFLSSDAGELVFAVLRGDLETSLEKLAHVAGAGSLRPSTDAEIAAAGAVPGFASPIGLEVRKDRAGVRVVADPSVYTGCDLVAGANAPDFHFVHVDPRRDFSVTEVADIALAPAGARCSQCRGELEERHAMILAWSSPLAGPMYSDESGGEKRAAAGWLAVDLLALLEEIVGACGDDQGIAWPVALAPADVHVISLKEDEAARDASQALEQEGLTVLLDDRPIGAGAKFADADLIGCPLRVTVSSRSLQAGGAELSGRRGLDPSVVPLAQLARVIQDRRAALMSS